jgi:hypothetical protein
VLLAAGIDVDFFVSVLLGVNAAAAAGVAVERGGCWDVKTGIEAEVATETETGATVATGNDGRARVTVAGTLHKDSINDNLAFRSVLRMT